MTHLYDGDLLPRIALLRWRIGPLGPQIAHALAVAGSFQHDDPIRLVSSLSKVKREGVRQGDRPPRSINGALRAPFPTVAKRT